MAWKVFFYQDEHGRHPALEFLNSMPVADQARARNALRLLQEFGPQLRMPHAKKIADKLWELRPGGLRFFYCAYIGQQFVILHGYRKQSQKAPEKEIKTALRRMRDLLKEE